MSEYLKQLKALDFKKDRAEAPSEPLKAPFSGFGGASPGHFRKCDTPFSGSDGGHSGPFSKNGVSQIGAWRAAIEALPAPCNRDGERLLNSSLAFLESEHVPAALSFGWDEAPLFGIHKGIAPRQRVDAWGLVTFLAWSALKLSIAEITARHCELTSQNAQGGSRLMFRRDRPGNADMAAWWLHPSLIGDAS
jgi:hypothetical protein